MIYTVTFNPSLDYIVSVQNFHVGIVNRTMKEILYPGGKGINVSIVLKNLGFDNTALGFIAGFTGEEVKKRLKDHGIHTDFITLKEGLSRINVKLRSDEESEINGQGPVIESQDIEALYDKLDKLKDEDILVLAGSIPTSISDEIYMTIMKKLEHKKIRIVVDATKDLLMNVLKYHPFLIKPNKHELSEIFGVTLNDPQDIMKYAKKLKEMGAQNVLVSMAGDGAILVTEQGDTYCCEAPKGKVKNSVGAGDSMVAGFIAGYLDHKDYKEAFKMGVSTGSASAFSEELATKEEVIKILMSHSFGI